MKSARAYPAIGPAPAIVHQMPSAIAGSVTPHNIQSPIAARYWRSTSQALRISAA